MGRFKQLSIVSQIFSKSSKKTILTIVSRRLLTLNLRNKTTFIQSYHEGGFFHQY